MVRLVQYTVPRLVASDLDGTLLHSDGTLSGRSVRAIVAAEAAGATVVLVTGRPPRWIHHIVEQLGHHGVALCANGALVYDLETRSVLSSDTIDLYTAAEIISRIRRDWPGAVFAVETPSHLGIEPAWEVNFALPEGTHVADAVDLLTAPPVKILARLDGHPFEDALAHTTKELAGLAEVTWSGGRHLLEMSAAGVTKGVALTALADRLGVAASEAVAFGDMPNDVAMLRWAGRGLAVANAHPTVREIADGIVGANDDDGVAAELEAIFGLDPSER